MAANTRKLSSTPCDTKELCTVWTVTEVWEKRVWERRKELDPLCYGPLLEYLERKYTPVTSLQTTENVQ